MSEAADDVGALSRDESKVVQGEDRNETQGPAGVSLDDERRLLEAQGRSRRRRFLSTSAAMTLTSGSPAYSAAASGDPRRVRSNGSSGTAAEPVAVAPAHTLLEGVRYECVRSSTTAAGELR
jgi:hypothetical protein